MNKHIPFGFICGLGLVACNSESGKQKVQTDKTEKTNIVCIVADDLGWSQIGCYGSSYYQTPNIDMLAENGIRFSSAYSAAAVSSPTRASLMTGKYPARLHLTDFIAGNNRTDYPLQQPQWQKHLPLNETTFAEIVKKQGYQTAYFGKWHLSRAKTPPESLSHNPNKQGFDTTFVTYKPSKRLAQPWQDAENDAHNTDTITNLAVNFINSNQNNPFVLMVAYNTIHDPLKEKQVLIQKYDTMQQTTAPENHAVIAAMIETMDLSVGRIVNALEKNLLIQNTVVIFYSDNGGKHTYAKQTPLRSGKGWLYEGGIRVPLIIQWNGVISPNSSTDAMVSSIDFFPTFLDITNSDKSNCSNIDGMSLLPVIKDSDKEVHKALYWHYPHYHQGSGMKPASAVRLGKWKLIEWHEEKLQKKTDYFELYNLEKDIGETTNLADSFKEKGQELLDSLQQWKNRIDAQMPEVNSK